MTSVPIRLMHPIVGEPKSPKSARTIPPVVGIAGGGTLFGPVNRALAGLVPLLTGVLLVAGFLRSPSQKPYLFKRGVIGGLAAISLLSLMVAVDYRGLLSPSASVPEGTLKARVEALPPAGHATALRATFWSNGVPVAIAEAIAKYSRLVLETTQKMREVGKATALDLRGAQATNNIAEIELVAARRRALAPGVTGEAAGRVQFFGEMRGQVELPAGRPTQLAEAIWSLGKTSEFAGLRKVKVQRADGTTVVVDVRKVIQENRRDLDLDLRDGDRVEVPKRIL